MAAILAIEKSVHFKWIHFWLETDFMLLLHAFSHPLRVHWSLYTHWMNCKKPTNNLNFRITHIYCEGNACANKLAS